LDELQESLGLYIHPLLILSLLILFKCYIMRSTLQLGLSSYVFLTS